MMSTNEVHTISEFLARTGTRFRVFDMGRRVVPLSNREFSAFENFDAPYPYPLQQQAWFGLLCWNGETQSDQFIWFLRMPLDELGCLVPAARHDFMYSLLEHLGARLEANQRGDGLEDVMAESVYGFKPVQNRMAVFHAKAQRLLNQAPSHYYQPARDYLAGNLGYEQWQFLGVQGLADVSVRWDLDGNVELLRRAVAEIPEMPWTVLCECLENENLDTALVEAIDQRVRSELASGAPRPAVIAGGLRAISGAQATGLRQQLVRDVLGDPAGQHIEVIAAVGGRCWEDLREAGVAGPFLEALAAADTGSDSFRAMLADLMFIPGMREPLLRQMRNPERSERLASVLAAFFGGS